MNYSFINFLKKIFIFYWNLFSRINFYLKKKNIKNQLKNKSLKKINILLVKPFYYSDLYSANINDPIEIIKSSQYRMGPIGLLFEFNPKVVISNYYGEIKLKKINKKNVRQKYFTKQYKQSIDFNKFDFSKFDWVISIKDSIPKKIIKKNSSILWTMLFEDHREKNYLKYNIFGNKKYDLTFDTTQGFTPYDIFKNKKSISFPYTFSHNNICKKLLLKNNKKKQIVMEIYQPNYLSFKSIGNFNIVRLDGKLRIYEYFKVLSKTKYFYCPIYNIPRWGNSIIEAATFNCLIIGNTNCFWNSLIIQNECIAKNHLEGLAIIKKFEKNKSLYDKVLKKQQIVFNMINFNRPLDQIKKCVSENFRNKKISKLL